MNRSVSCVALSIALSLGVFPQQDLSEFEKRLSKINEQIKDARSRIKQEETKEATVLVSLERIGLNKRLIRSQLDLYRVQLEKTNKEQSDLKVEAAQLRVKLESEQQSVEKTLATLYKFGKFSFLRFLLQSDSIGDLFNESKHLSILARYQEKTISEYLANLAQLGKATETMETKRKEIADLAVLNEQKKKELEDQEQKNQSLVDQIRKNKNLYQKTLDELNTSSEQLQVLMKKLINQEFTLPLPFVPLYELKGKLPWPLEGRIITRFGLQTHPNFNTTTLNNGIEIAPPKDKLLIAAIHPGKVVFTDFFQGYGNLVIIDHGMTYYSLYGHCSEFLVKTGDPVRSEQPVATVGDSGSLQGTCLYFEIRYKTKPLDPLQWLKRR